MCSVRFGVDDFEDSDEDSGEESGTSHALVGNQPVGCTAEGHPDEDSNNEANSNDSGVDGEVKCDTSEAKPEESQGQLSPHSLSTKTDVGDEGSCGNDESKVDTLPSDPAPTDDVSQVGYLFCCGL